MAFSKRKIVITGLAIIYLLSAILLFVANINTVQETKKSQQDGIFLLNQNGKVIKHIKSDRQYVLVRRNDVIITGSPKSDIAIALANRIEKITINDLDQGEHEIDIYTSETKDVSVNFKGENVIDTLCGFKGLKVNGENEDDILILTEDLCAVNKMEISTGIIKTASIFVDGGMDIINSTCITVEPKADNDYAYIEVFGTLKIDLDEGGFLSVKNDLYDDDKPIYVEALELGPNTKIIEPMNGYLSKDPDDRTKRRPLVLFSEDGTTVDEIEIGFYDSGGVR